MPLAPPPPNFSQQPPAQVARLSVFKGVKYREPTVNGNPFAVTGGPPVEISHIELAGQRYFLSKPFKGSHAASSLGYWFAVDGEPLSRFVGYGDSPRAAEMSWALTFEREFLRLFSMRPFEMSPAEREIWAAIEGRLDVDAFRTSQPLVCRQIGIVIRARPHPQKIQWEDGTSERVNLNLMPAEFGSYQTGQTFEAVVKRDPVSHRMIGVDQVQRLAKTKLSAEESQALRDSIPTSKSLPDASWD